MLSGQQDLFQISVQIEQLGVCSSRVGTCASCDDSVLFLE